MKSKEPKCPYAKLLSKIKGLLMSDDIEITKYDNFKFNQIIQKQGLNSNKSNYKSKQKNQFINKLIYLTESFIQHQHLLMN